MNSNSKPYARASLVLLGLAWTLPFLQPYHFFPITSFYSEWLAFALGLSATLLLARSRSWPDATLPVVALAPLGLVLVLGLQILSGRAPYAGHALTGILYLLWSALLMALGHVLRRDLTVDHVATGLSGFLVAGGVLSATAGLLQHYGITTPFDFLIALKVSSGLYGNLAQANHYAQYLTLALASLAYLVCRGRIGTVAGALLMLLLVPPVVLSGSRGVLLYLLALAVLALFFHWRLGSFESRRLVLFMGGVFLAFLFFQWLVAIPALAPEAGPFETSARRLFHAQTAADAITHRVQHVREAWWMFVHAPLLGVGFGHHAWYHFLYVASTGNDLISGISVHTHNIVTQLLAETGILGAAVALGPVVLWIWDLKSARPDIALWWLLALLIALGIHSMLEFPLWYSFFLGIAALLFGLGAERVYTPRWSGLTRALVALGVVVGWLNLVTVLISYRDLERLVFLPQAIKSSSATDERFGRKIADIHSDPLLTPYVELAIAFGVTVSEERLQEKLELVTRAMHLAPVAIVVYRQALLLALAGERESAMTGLDRALRVYPADASEIASQLEVLVGGKPREFEPLLRLASARAAEFRAYTYGNE